MSKPTIYNSDVIVYTNGLTPYTATAITNSDFSDAYYVWNMGDGTVLDGESISHIYEEAGVYEVTLTRYMDGGDPVTSDSVSISAVNLIPNLMEWDSDFFGDSNITASVKGDSPYKVNVWNSYQQYDENSILHLYVENSKSMPFDITDKRAHLKPTWRFLDEDDNVLNTLSLNQTKIYASLSDGEIIISTDEVDDSLFVGVSSTAEFYFIDDTPSGIDQSDDYTSSTIVVTQNLSGTYGDDKFTSEDTIQYPSIIKTVTVDNIIPTSLEITSNGVFDIPYIKFANTRIPFTIRLVDQNGNYIKTNPFDADNIQNYTLDIGFDGEVSLSSYPELSGNSLERFSLDFSNLGGFYESYFIPLSSTTDTVALTASTLIDYVDNVAITRYGAFSDENSEYIYQISHDDNYVTSYKRRLDTTDGDDSDGGISSNKFGIIVDKYYNSVFLDSDSHKLSKYSSGFNLDNELSLSSYGYSPAQATMDQSGNYYITLYDSKKIIYVSNSLSQDFVLQSFEEDDEYPAAIEYLNTGSYWTSFISLSGNNMLRRYNQLQNTDALAEINTGGYQGVDMVSDNNEDPYLYVLFVDNTTYEAVVSRLNSTEGNEYYSYSVGFHNEFITIDTDQNIWTIGAVDVEKSSYNLYKIDTDTNGITTYSINGSFGGNGNHFGGIAGDSRGKIWLLDSNGDRVIIFDKDDLSSYSTIQITEDLSVSNNLYVAYGDWNGWRWLNKFGNTLSDSVVTYELSGKSNDFKIFDTGSYNLQKVNEDFDMTDTLKSYRTTDAMYNYEHLFDDFFGSIYGNKYDDGTYLGKNYYEKIANFVMNHADIDTCNIDALQSFCEETGIDFEQDITYPRDVKRLVDLFSIKFKRLWGDDYVYDDIDDIKGDEIDINTYVLSANPQTNILAVEKFNNHNTIITPLSSEDGEVLSAYTSDWTWGLAVPSGSYVGDYYDFYEMLSSDTSRTDSIIDWENELTDTDLKPLSTYTNYMTDTGIVSTVLGDQLREGLDIYV